MKGQTNGTIMKGLFKDIFVDYSELYELVLGNNERDQWCEEMSYGNDSNVQDQESDATQTADNDIQIPIDREAGKAVASCPFQI